MHPHSRRLYSVKNQGMPIFVTASHQTELDTRLNDLKVDYSGGLEEGKVGQEPKLGPCLTMLVIGPLSAMWAWWAELEMEPNLGQGTYAW